MSNQTSESPQTISIHSLLMIVGLILGIAVLIVLGLFFWQVRGGFSGDPADWGAFGSYVGGTLATVVAMISAIAVIYTISLQKKILDTTQKFSLQTIEQQRKIISSTLEFNESTHLENHRQRLLNVLSIHLDKLVRKKQGSELTVAKVMEENGLSQPSGRAQFMGSVARVKKINNEMDIITTAIVKFSREKFDNVDEINEIFDREYLPLITEIPKA